MLGGGKDILRKSEQFQIIQSCSVSIQQPKKKGKLTNSTQGQHARESLWVSKLKLQSICHQPTRSGSARIEPVTTNHHQLRRGLCEVDKDQ